MRQYSVPDLAWHEPSNSMLIQCCNDIDYPAQIIADISSADSAAAMLDFAEVLQSEA